MTIKCKRHLTAHDKKVIKASFYNDFQNVFTPKKRLNIVCISKDKTNAIAELYSLQVGIGIDSKQSWHKTIVEFTK